MFEYAVFHVTPTYNHQIFIPGAQLHTHSTQPFYGSMDFVWDNPGELVPEETFTHSYLLWSSIVPYLLHPSNMIRGILPITLNKNSFRAVEGRPTFDSYGLRTAADRDQNTTCIRTTKPRCYLCLMFMPRVHAEQT